MNEINKKYLLSFFLLISFWTFLFLYYSSSLGNLNAILTLLLAWSFYILCIPAHHGKFILNVPAKFIFKRKIKYPEIYLWFCAIVLNLVLYNLDQMLYFNTLVTHLLYIMFIKPWPYLMLFLANALYVFFNFLTSKTAFLSNKYVRFVLRRILQILIIILLYQFLYKHFVILIDAHAIG